jgi:hypothetical protein
MGMGYYGAYADVIEEANIIIFCPKEFQEFKNVLNKYDMDMSEIARDIDYECSVSLKGTEAGKAVMDTYIKLVEQFKKRTGLNLYLSYHDSECCGDRYDEIHGIYWAVDNMYELTPAGKKMKEYVTRSFFVQFG